MDYGRKLQLDKVEKLTIELAEKLGIAPPQIYFREKAHTNICVWLGKHAIYINADFLSLQTWEQEFALAHELGHLKHKRIAWATYIGSMSTLLLGLAWTWVTCPFDSWQLLIQSFGVMALTNYFLMPLLKRHEEHLCDFVAVELVGMAALQTYAWCWKPSEPWSKESIKQSISTVCRTHPAWDKRVRWVEQRLVRQEGIKLGLA